MMNTRSESGAAPACAQRSVSPDHPTAGNYKEKSTMKRTLWTMAAIAPLAICMTSCGGGKDYATSICDRLQSCKELSLVNGATTVTECEKTANQQLSVLSSSDRTTTEKAADECLASPDCAGFTSCMSTLISQGPSVGTDYASMMCNKLSSCGSLSQMGMTTVSQCITTANSELSAIPASSRAQANAAIDQCLALTCASATQCISSLAASLP
jgi:hypothetical protein